jgi:hypothetical protein
MSVCGRLEPARSAVCRPGATVKRTTARENHLRDIAAPLRQIDQGVRFMDERPVRNLPGHARGERSHRGSWSEGVRVMRRQCRPSRATATTRTRVSGGLPGGGLAVVEHDLPFTRNGERDCENPRNYSAAGQPTQALLCAPPSGARAPGGRGHVPGIDADPDPTETPAARSAGYVAHMSCHPVAPLSANRSMGLPSGCGHLEGRVANRHQQKREERNGPE